MQKDLLKLRDEAESKFEALKNSINSIDAELKKHGVATLDEAMVELNRLQGEFRALNKAIDLKKPKANEIDATTVDPEAK